MKTLSDLISLFRSSQANKDAVIAAKDEVIKTQAAELERRASEDATEDTAYEAKIAELTQRVAALEEKDAAEQAEIEAAYDEFDGDPVVETPVDEAPSEETPVVEPTPVDTPVVDETPVGDTTTVEVEEVTAEEAPSF